MAKHARLYAQRSVPKLTPSPYFLRLSQLVSKTFVLVSLLLLTFKEDYDFHRSLRYSRAQELAEHVHLPTP